MKPDPIELELFRHLLISVAEEMGTVLRKTSFSANIKERRDYSCAVYDPMGRTVAMGDHMPVHLGAMPLSVQQVQEAFDLRAGDVAIVNDPFRGGTHLPDITAVTAVFVKGSAKPAFFVANRAHHADVGGMSPGSMPMAREIYQEGIRIPPVLLVRRGKVDRQLLDLVLANVRTPYEREGDILAQWMSLKRGQERLQAIVAKYGLRRVHRNLEHLLDYSERMMRAAIGRLPEGVYRFEDFLDSDGICPKPVKIAVSITLQGSGAKVDFSGSDPQAEGPVNANYAIAVAATMYVFRCLIREDVPFTQGLMRPIQVIAPEGTVVNAKAPAAMAAGNVETSQRITDVLLGALAQAAPDEIPAASSGTMNNLSFGGWDPRRNRAFAYYETIAGGMGASARADGWSATHTHMTNSWNTPIEALEHLYPVRVRRYQIRRGSGGKGLHCGGNGIERELEFLAAADVTILSDRRQRGPYGLCGGSAGAPGRNLLDGAPLEGKTTFRVAPGSRLLILTPGGGGWGEVK
ncbi:MAG: hydantoinase B/oxoprolinase family protein [Bryobacteraceae bacterium]|nr:hydantoinase B/oxoprolinase family protein [Bryobacteraceae bacterium]MDW8379000.1 hydantoinase B/oxoprolinase family protein [Bryobacterales bacterium]